MWPIGVAPVLNGHSLIKRLEEVSISVARHIAGDRFAGGRIRKMHVFRLINALEPVNKTFLDAGCGFGDYSVFVSRFPGAKVVGIDQDAAAIRWCKEKYESRLHNVAFYVQTLTESLGDQLYDVIICIDVLDDIREDTETIVYLYRCLKSPGVLILHVPLAGGPMYFRCVEKFRYELSVRQYQVDEIRRKLLDAGFRIYKSKYTFGWAGSLARELWYYACKEKNRLILQVLIHPLVMLFSRVDVIVPISRGRGYLVVCEKLNVGVD